ncbi:MAG: hypothetical protein OXD31_11120 [Chloroflexi bacterium]|nr:hypothetical protein [Chloroflexota bacterium]
MKNAASSPALLIAAAALFLSVVTACTTEKTVYVLPDGTEVTPTAAQATQIAGESTPAAASQPEEVTVQPTSAPTASATASREDRLIRLVIENKPPSVTGYGFQQRVDYTPECAEVFYIYGSSISGRPPKFAYAAPARGLYDAAIRCDDDGNHYFTNKRYVDMLWKYLGGE